MKYNAPRYVACQNSPGVSIITPERWNGGTIRLPERVTDPSRIAAGGIRSGLDEGEYDWLFDPPPDHAVALCRTFLELYGRPTPRLRRTATSYGHKHCVERWHREQTGERVYIPQGAFIMAALHLGYQVEQAREDSPNAVFNLRLNRSTPRKPHRRGF